MRSIIAAATARTPRPFARILTAVSRAAGSSARHHAYRDADGLSDHLLGDLGLVPVSRPQDSRAHLASRRGRPRARAVHEIDFAYYAALTQRNG
jgi:hypothetical protein